MSRTHLFPLIPQGNESVPACAFGCDSRFRYSRIVCGNASTLDTGAAYEEHLGTGTCGAVGCHAIQYSEGV
jgi:hypothetical protein